MNDYKFIRTFPGEAGFEDFSTFPKQIYSNESQRFILGHDPVQEHLKGCYILKSGQSNIGRFAFYENPELQYHNESACTIGSYECIDDLKASHELLKHAQWMAKEKGCRWLIGPMEGSTWHNYRFSQSNVQPNFFMEPYHHIYYNQQFTDFGFEPIAEYVSNLDETLAYDEDKLIRFENYFVEQGAKFRHLDLNNYRQELVKMGKLSLEGFAENFLYTPISLDAFVNKYEKLKKLIDPDLVWIGEDQKGYPHALLFAIHDHWDQTGETMIIKSMVRKPDTPFRGMASYLAGKSIQLANDKGYKKIIHALMIRDNASVRTSDNYAGRPYKSYQLYGLRL